MSSRRHARAKRSPSFNVTPATDPNRSYRESFDHPVLGRVLVTRQDGTIRRIRTEVAPFPPSPQNFFGPLSTDRHFERLLKLLHLDR